VRRLALLNLARMTTILIEKLQTPVNYRAFGAHPGQDIFRQPGQVWPSNLLGAFIALHSALSQ